MNGGEALVRTLLCHGVRTAFCVPGESFLAVLDALARRAGEMRLITNRHESGAAFAANGYAKIARRPGIAFVSRGPAAASIVLRAVQRERAPALPAGRPPALCFVPHGARG